MANDHSEDDVSHSNRGRSYVWSIILKDLRQLKKKELRRFGDAESNITLTCSFVHLEEHLNRYQIDIQENLRCRDDMDLLESVLRVALCYLSFPPSFASDDCVEWRRTIQAQAFGAWHVALLELILDKDIAFSQCRKAAAQILCNSITDCVETASRLMRLVSPAPSESRISHKLFSDHIQSATNNGTDGELYNSSKSSTIDMTNWVDLILASASHRPTLAVVVACLHNCLCALSPSFDFRNELVYPVSESTLLNSTLMRHVISAAAVLPRSSNQTAKMDGGASADDATEWIGLTISKLCRLGRLPNIYQSIHPGTLNDCVLPEHVVLLHVVRNLMEEAANRSDLGHKKGSVGHSRCFLLGGEVDGNDGHGIVEAHRFLSSLYLALRDAKCSSIVSRDLQPAAIQLVLDILSESLAEDSAVATTCRFFIGTETLFLPALVSDLAATLDAWYEANKDVYTRHQTKLSETDQCRVTASVRVLGNLCYHCARNQDLLRETAIPYYNVKSETQGVSYTEGSSMPKPVDRNGLHVLLSTTSLSYACFTLREWAVVAIRAALEECPQNQAVVAELEALSSVKSADLEYMGIRVNLDTTRGVVSVSTVND